MRRIALVALGLLAVLAAIAASASSRGTAVAVPSAFAPAKEGEPILAVVPGQRGPVLGRADKRAVWIARRSRRLRIFNQLTAWAYSPERDVVAIATESQAGGSDPIPTIQYIHPYLVQRLWTTKLKDGHVAAMSWTESRLNVVAVRWCCPASFDVIGIDPDTHRVATKRRFARAALQVGRAGDSIVVLTAPAAGIGPAGLLVVDPDGKVRSVALDRIVAGTDLPNEGESPDPAKMRQNIPALAVDPAGRAFVVPASGAVAEVSLSTLAVSYHTVAEPVSLLGRLHDWIEPKAAAKGVTGPTRAAKWLGDGVVAVSGGDEAATVDPANQMHVSWTPAGLRLIDTNTWGSKLIDRGADSFTVEGGTLLATGSSWTTEGTDRAMGLAAYGFDGTRRFSVLAGRSAAVALVFRRRAYVGIGDRGPTKVVDLTRGKLMKDRRTPLARLLIGDGSG